MLPRVSIVVLGYLETNRPYLEACLESVANLNYPKELLDIVVVSSWYDGPHKRIATPKPGGFSHSVNAGVRATDPTTEHILILSDDTIVTKNALANMIKATFGVEMIVAAISNCDNQWKYMLHIPYVESTRFYKRDQLYLKREMMNAESPYPMGLINTDTLCFYAVLIPRAVWNRVGELDERFNMGYEDTDYCQRAAKLGIFRSIALDALIYHAGGASESIITQEMRDSNVKHYEEKWLGPYE